VDSGKDGMTNGSESMALEAASCGLEEGHDSATSSRRWAGKDVAVFSVIGEITDSLGDHGEV
jgi:hypothetical protein